MHHDHDHDHPHHHHHDHHHPHTHANGHARHESGSAGIGHNHAHASRDVAQWQTPHRHADHPAASHEAPGELDLDQVEAAFIEGFLSASNPTGFLRLASIPFHMTVDGGAELRLLRVETDVVADVASITPHLGGQSFRYDPLPASRISHRRRLRFIYFDGAALRSLSYAEIRRHAQLSILAPTG